MILSGTLALTVVYIKVYLELCQSVSENLAVNQSLDNHLLSYSLFIYLITLPVLFLFQMNSELVRAQLLYLHSLSYSFFVIH